MIYTSTSAIFLMPFFPIKARNLNKFSSVGKQWQLCGLMTCINKENKMSQINTTELEISTTNVSCSTFVVILFPLVISKKQRHFNNKTGQQKSNGWSKVLLIQDYNNKLKNDKTRLCNCDTNWEYSFNIIIFNYQRTILGEKGMQFP